MRKFFWITIFIVALVLLAFFSPWRQIRIDLAGLFGIEQQESTAGLVVSSYAGKINVFIDGQAAGAATAETPLVLPNITPGDRLIKLERESQIPDAFISYSKLLTLLPGSEGQISYELGPSIEFSGGHLIYAAGVQTNNRESLRLNVKSNVQDAEVFINDTSIGNAPINAYQLPIGSQYKLELRKAGYESQAFTILPDSQEDRNKLGGFDLNVEVDLFLQPIRIQIDNG